MLQSCIASDGSEDRSELCSLSDGASSWMQMETDDLLTNTRSTVHVVLSKTHSASTNNVLRLRLGTVNIAESFFSMSTDSLPMLIHAALSRPGDIKVIFHGMKIRKAYTTGIVHSAYTIYSTRDRVAYTCNGADRTRP